MDISIEPYEKDGYKINGIRYTKIRPIVMGIVIYENKALLTEHHTKEVTFNRCIGGGIQFGELGEEALKREFMEELGTNIKHSKYLGTDENIFFHKGMNNHELIMFYEVKLDTNEYEDEYQILDADLIAKWINVDDIISGNKPVYPEKIREYIKTIVNEK